MAVIVSLVILYVGYEIVMEAMGERIVRLQNVTLAAASLLGVVTIGYGFSRYEARVGKALNSPSLMADAKHMRADMFANAAVENLVTEGTTVKDALEGLGISYGIDEMKNQLEPSLASASENDQVTNSRAV